MRVTITPACWHVMHVNRMIRSSQRAHELVIHDLRRRLEDGQVARSKQQVRKPA